MNLRLLIILCVVQVFTSCNEENIEAARRTTIVDLICQEPDFTIFCELLHLSSDLDNDTIPDIIWRLEYAGVEFYDSVANQFCASNVETVFVPNDSSLMAFLDSLPRWTTLNDIPQDTIDIFVESHIYGGDSSNHPNGALLYIEISNPICLEANVIPGSQNPYKMLDESSILFAINPTNGYLGILTTQNFRFSTSSGIPDLIVEDAIAYKIDHHLTPF